MAPKWANFFEINTYPIFKAWYDLFLNYGFSFALQEFFYMKNKRRWVVATFAQLVNDWIHLN